MAITQNYGTGRRKSSTARVFLRKGEGKITINERPLDEFFGRETARMIVRQPLELTKNTEIVRHQRHGRRRRHHRPGRCDPPRHRPRAGRVRRDAEVRAAQGRVHDPRRARSRAQEGRPAQGAPRYAVLQALSFEFIGRGVTIAITIHIAPSPSGKAPDSDSGIRWFESIRGCQFKVAMCGRSAPSHTGSPPRAGFRVPDIASRLRQDPEPAMVATFSAPYTPASGLLTDLRERGYAVLAADDVAVLCGVTIAQLDALKPSWDDLQPDRYLRDGGSYRRRRHSCFLVDAGNVVQAPHRAHWQSRDYNALHGGMQRWFEPITPAVVSQPAWERLLQALGDQFTQLKPRAAVVRRSAPVPHRHQRRHRSAYAGRRASRRGRFRRGPARRPRSGSTAAKRAYSTPPDRTASALP